MKVCARVEVRLLPHFKRPETGAQSVAENGVLVPANSLQRTCNMSLLVQFTVSMACDAFLLALL